MLQMQKIRLYYLCAPFWVACPHSCQICPNCPGFCTLDRGNKSIAKKRKNCKKQKSSQNTFLSALKDILHVTHNIVFQI